MTLPSSDFSPFSPTTTTTPSTTTLMTTLNSDTGNISPTISPFSISPLTSPSSPSKKKKKNLILQNKINTPSPIITSSPTSNMASSRNKKRVRLPDLVVQPPPSRYSPIRILNNSQEDPVVDLLDSNNCGGVLSPKTEMPCCFQLFSPAALNATASAASGLSPFGISSDAAAISPAHLSSLMDLSPSPSVAFLDQLLVDICAATKHKLSPAAVSPTSSLSLLMPSLPLQANCIRGEEAKISALDSDNSNNKPLALSKSAINHKKKNDASATCQSVAAAVVPSVSSDARSVASPSSSDAATTTATTVTQALRVPDFTFDPERTWKTVFVDRSFLSAGDDDVEVRAKTRCDTPCLSVPDRLYSSMKYEIRQRAVGQFVNKVPFLLSRISVVDPVSGLEVRRNNRPAVKGTIEAALVKPTDKKKKRPALAASPNALPLVLEGNLRAQFQDISFHADHALYCWQISYFSPSDLEHAILTKRSPSFKVFARKPGNPAPTRKRKRDATASTHDSDLEDYRNDDVTSQHTEDDSCEQKDTPETIVVAKSSKLPRVQAATAADGNVAFDDFVFKLDELVKCKDRLSAQERQVCLDLVVSQLLAADPSYFSSFLFPSCSVPPSLDFLKSPTDTSPSPIQQSLSSPTNLSF